MKSTLLFAMLSLVFAAPQAKALTELETLRAKCVEQERQILRLEQQLQKQKPASEQATPAAKTSAPTAASADASTYTVKKGDSLGRIARRAGCTPAKLAKANGIKATAMIHPGQNLKLPGTAVANVTPPKKAAETSPAAAPAAPSAGKTYTIKQGETYASISRKTRISVNSLMAANPGVKATALRPGQVIKLSAGSAPAAVASAPAPQKTAEPIAKTTAPSHSTVVSNPVKSPAPATPTHTAAASLPASKTIPVSNPKPAAAPAPAPAKAPATETAAAPAPATDSTLAPNNPEKKIRSVTIEGEMTYGEFATKHGTDTSRLNDLDGLDLTNATVLAKGSELYVPAQP